MSDMLEHAAIWFDLASERMQHSFLACGSSLVASVELIVDAMVRGHRVLVCGNGGSSANAQAFVAMMIHRYQRERPPLPAHLLTPDIATFSAIVGESSFADVYARPVRAYGQRDDVLLCMSATGQAINILQAIDAAHDREMRVVALTGYEGDDIARMLRETDIQIHLPFDRHAAIHTAHHAILHCMAHLIDEQLFGVEDE